MKILNTINFLNIKCTNRIRNINNINFCGANSLSKDIFEKSPIKTVTIKNTKGNNVDAIIKEEFYKDDTGFFGTNPKMLSLNVNGKRLGYAVMYDSKDEDELYVKELYTEENFRRHYKGAGTELLKCLVEESKKRGHKGKISLTASNVPPPFVFYYKNNFQAISKYPQYIAAIDYAARNNVPVSKLLPDGVSALTIQLDEEGAEAFLAGKKLYEQKNSFTIAKTNISNKEFEASYTEAEDGCFYFQIISKNVDKKQQRWFATGKFTEENGKKYIRLYPIDENFYASNKVCEFAKESAQILAEKTGVDAVEIIEENL